MKNEKLVIEIRKRGTNDDEWVQNVLNNYLRKLIIDPKQTNKKF